MTLSRSSKKFSLFQHDTTERVRLVAAPSRLSSRCLERRHCQFLETLVVRRNFSAKGALTPQKLIY